MSAAGAGLIPAAAIYSLSIDPNNPITPTCDITASECATPLRLGQGIPYSYTRYVKDEDEWSDTNVRINLDYEPNDNQLWYFSYTTGFRSGGYALGISGQYDSERDEFGVPHVIGKTDKDASFGFGYAQTEDDYENIEFAIKMARGSLSDFDFSFESISTLYSLITGKGDILSNLSAIKGVELDFLIKFMNVEEVVSNKKNIIDQNIITYLKGYADGINYWAALNPNKVDQSIFPVSENDLLVGMVFRMPLFYGFDHYIEELIDLLSDEEKLEVATNSLSHQPLIASVKSHFNPSGSNAFAVSKKRSANNETLLVINSHQPLTGPVAWYEAHIKSDEGLNIMGGTFPGSPFIHVGFNEYLGWGATVNQPDLGDIYELTINPENENQYLLDGEWVDFRIINQNFRVKLFGPFAINYPLDMYFSEHGPVLKDGTKAYALRYVGMEDVNQVTEWYRLNKAESFVLSNQDYEFSLIGTLVTSDKPIVMNSGSATGSFAETQGGQDYGIDQIVGSKFVGSEYIFIRGNGENEWENVLIIADQDNTEVSINGVVFETLNEGDYRILEGDQFSANGNMYVKTTDTEHKLSLIHI